MAKRKVERPPAQLVSPEGLGLVDQMYAVAQDQFRAIARMRESLRIEWGKDPSTGFLKIDTRQAAERLCSLAVDAVAPIIRSAVEGILVQLDVRVVASRINADTNPGDLFCGGLGVRLAPSWLRVVVRASRNLTAADGEARERLAQFLIRDAESVLGYLELEAIKVHDHLLDTLVKEEALRGRGPGSRVGEFATKGGKRVGAAEFVSNKDAVRELKISTGSGSPSGLTAMCEDDGPLVGVYPVLPNGRRGPSRRGVTRSSLDAVKAKGRRSR